MDVEKKYSSSYEKLIMNKLKLIIKLIIFQFLGSNIIQLNEVNAIIPYYKSPTNQFLKDNGTVIGKNAYQLLYFGQYKQALNLAKLAISLDPTNEKLWSVLAEAQISNKLYNEALKSINKGKLLNPNLGELYFSESSIYLKQNKLQLAKKSLIKGIKIQPKNNNAIFQLGNIFLMEKNYTKALNQYNKSIKNKSNFWQAINNKGLIYFELDEKLQAINNFKQAISIERNGESMLALAASIQANNPKQSILLAKEALAKDPQYVSFKYRKEQLWGNKLQDATQKLFQKDELQQAIELANFYKN